MTAIGGIDRCVGGIKVKCRMSFCVSIPPFPASIIISLKPYIIPPSYFPLYLHLLQHRPASRHG
jgi:hypothetical protein